MSGRSLKLLYAIVTLLVHLEPALARVISGVGDGNMWCIERERQALLELKKGLIDDHNMLSSWGSEDAKKNCCSWEGVQCSYQTGHVVQLYLGGSNLIGPISSQIGNLSHLQSLYINDNQLEGGIPNSLGDICTLNYLDLSWNNLNGQVLEFFHNLKGCLKDSLETLDLHGNQITGLVPNFAIFSSLRVLRLYYNKLNGTLDESIGSLHKLEVLDLEWNMLGGVISEALLLNFTRLQFLLLSHNYFTFKISHD